VKTNEGTLTIHLKKINSPKGVCTKSGEVTKFLFDVTCRNCIDLVIEKRLIEISLLDEAKSKNKSVNQCKKVNKNDTVIRF